MRITIIKMKSDRAVILIVLAVFVISDVDAETTINLVITTDTKTITPFVKAACAYFMINHSGTKISCEIPNFDYSKSNLEEQACSTIKNLSSTNYIDAVLDFSTDITVTHEPITRALQKLSVNKIYVMYGFREDHSALNMYNTEYIQIQPPGHTIGNIISNIANNLGVTAVGVLYDKTIEMNYRYRNLLPNLPIRHIVMRIASTGVSGNELTEVFKQVIRLRELDITTFFIAANKKNILAVLESAAKANMFSRMFLWIAITTIVPAFTFDAISLTLSTLLKMKTENSHKEENQTILQCDSSASTNFRAEKFKNQTQQEVMHYQGIYGKFAINNDDQIMFMAFDVSLQANNKTAKDKQIVELVGMWTPHKSPQQNIFNSSFNISHITAKTVYQIATTEKPPFVYKIEKEGGGVIYEGYCIDLLNAMKVELKFEYEIYDVPETNGQKTPGTWPGIIGEVVERRAHIGLGPLFVISDQEGVVDFTIPFYDLVGMKILMKKPTVETSLFKFLTVMEPTVWASILCAYLLTSWLLWIIDTYSPFSYQNNKLKYTDDPEKREFTLKESLWFCITSLTPQGGGEAPKNMSGRLIAATWWLFSFIVIASYTANLAAFLTVSRLDSPIDSLDGLAGQFKIQYAPVNNSGAMNYFSRMAKIEEKFFDKWNEMTMKDGINEEDRLQYTVYDYPVGDKYTKIWQAMAETGFPDTLEEGIERIRNSSTGFALVADSTEVKYAVMSHCDLVAVGEEFSRRPLGLVVQKGSPLKEKLSTAILKLQNSRVLEGFKDKWWNNNPYKMECDEEDTYTDGISIKNIGGVFIVICVGMVIAWLVLGMEFFWHQFCRRNKSVVENVSKVHVQPSKQNHDILHKNLAIASHPIITKRYYFAS